MQSLRALPSDEDGGREVFEAPLQPKFQSNATPAPPQKIYPLAAPAKNSAKGPSQSFNSHETAGRQGKNTIRFQAMLAVAVCICLGWTLWLILLNVAPNDTVNRVMNTENFDYGSFWLMVDPSKTMFETILPGSRVTSTTVQLAFSLTRQDSSARKRIKLNSDRHLI
ncbi:hypothetical protein PC122_g23851 [Phytophthora cactorum]|nr:hypothetical protein PC122_g23851 [Phytophthora cactorum]